jgi:hypothetical protein
MISHPTQEVRISTADPSAIGCWAGDDDAGRVVSEIGFDQRRFVRYCHGRFSWADSRNCLPAYTTPSTTTPSAPQPSGRMRFSGLALARHGSSRWAYSATSSRQPWIPRNWGRCLSGLPDLQSARYQPCKTSQCCAERGRRPTRGVGCKPFLPIPRPISPSFTNS